MQYYGQILFFIVDTRLTVQGQSLSWLDRVQVVINLLDETHDRNKILATLTTQDGQDLTYGFREDEKIRLLPLRNIIDIVSAKKVKVEALINPVDSSFINDINNSIINFLSIQLTPTDTGKR